MRRGRGLTWSLGRWRPGHRGNADLHCSSDGRFVYTTTRTDDSVVAFTVQPDGSLAFLGKRKTSQLSETSLPEG